MKRVAVLVCILAGTLTLGGAAAFAGDDSEHGARKHREVRHHYKKKPQVRGYVARRGGYSYDQNAVINTYGDSGHVVAPLQFRDPNNTRQPQPFDNGFFYDSGIMLGGGHSPYMN